MLRPPAGVTGIFNQVFPLIPASLESEVIDQAIQMKRGVRLHYLIGFQRNIEYLLSRLLSAVETASSHQRYGYTPRSSTANMTSSTVSLPREMHRVWELTIFFKN
jgi:hypothetical protein